MTQITPKELEKLANSKGIEVQPGMFGCCEMKQIEFYVSSKRDSFDPMYVIEIHKQPECRDFDTKIYDCSKWSGDAEFRTLIKLNTALKNLKSLPDKDINKIRSEKGNLDDLLVWSGDLNSLLFGKKEND